MDSYKLTFFAPVCYQQIYRQLTIPEFQQPMEVVQNNT